MEDFWISGLDEVILWYDDDGRPVKTQQAQPDNESVQGQKNEEISFVNLEMQDETHQNGIEDFSYDPELSQELRDEGIIRK